MMNPIKNMSMKIDDSLDIAENIFNQRKNTFLRFSCFVIFLVIPPLLWYYFSQNMSYSIIVVSFFSLLLLLVSIASFIITFFQKGLDVSSSLFTIAVYLFALSLYTTGGTTTVVAMNILIVFLLIVIYLHGRTKQMWFWFLLTLLSTHLPHLITQNQYYKNPYELSTTLLFSLELFGLGLLFYFFVKINSDLIDLLKLQSKKLLESSAIMLSEVNQRKEAQKKLENLLIEEEKHNQLLLDTKKAMLNILSDLEHEQAKTKASLQDTQKFKLAVETVKEQIVITDSAGIILYANPATEQITGFSNEAILGKKVGTKDLWGGYADEEEYRTLWHKILVEKKRYTGEFENKRKNGQKYIAEVTISPVLNDKNEVSFFVGVERDVTEARRIDQMKTDFISLASHQLRTPLSAIRWFVEMLINGDAGELKERQQEILLDLDSSTRRMIDLVNGLLNISRLESGRLIVEPEETNLLELIENSISDIQPILQKKEQSVSVEQNTPKEYLLSIDPKLIIEVLKNLLTNASKYSEAGKKITVNLSENESEVIVAVIDQGVGIPENEHNQIFERFFRASNAVDWAADGTGLGLYLVKLIMEASGGRVWFESTQGVGTTFYFSLPKAGSPSHSGEVKLSD